MATEQPSRMAEDYLTAVWKAYEWPGGRATTTDLAARLGVTAPTVSAGLKKLARDGYLEYEPYGAIELTEAGRAIATRVVRRHRLIETYLVTRLGLAWDEVHDEADLLEHAVSDRVLERMDEVLGRPERDPHGDPIPRADGAVVALDAAPLAEARQGDAVTVARVADRHPEVLRYLTGKGVELGTALRVLDRLDASGAMRVEIAGAPVELSRAAADAVRVAPASAPGGTA
jgi:DtxR family transcriptional regulator, Mn-dependent transcriptional regulator